MYLLTMGKPCTTIDGEIEYNLYKKAYNICKEFVNDVANLHCRFIIEKLLPFTAKPSKCLKNTLKMFLKNSFAKGKKEIQFNFFVFFMYPN